MDEIDIKILNLLRDNARVTVSEIGTRISLSTPAVSERLKKLEVSGAIEKYSAILNPSHFNKNLTSIMFISLERPKYTDKFIEFIKCEDDVLECNYIAGDYDYLLKIVTDSTHTLEKLLNKIKGIPGIQKTKTVVVLSTVKDSHSIVPGI